MINSIENNLKILSRTPAIDSRYYKPENKVKNVVVLGSSKNSKELDKYLKACSDVTRYFVENGYNIVHGCGTMGIMGETYATAQKYSAKNANNKPVQNLGIITEQLWGNENLENCILIGKASSEADRIEKFVKVSDKFVIFPGSAGTIQEASTLVSKNVYNQNPPKIVLFGSDFWKPFEMVFKKIMEFDLLKNKHLFDIADNVSDAVKFLLRK
jgi:predicted Rossmann-fold nucleotide-binding protein